jgi:hypothetical protein
LRDFVGPGRSRRRGGDCGDLVVNGFLGFRQEYQAEWAVLALRAMTAPRARVLRDDRTALIAAAEVVPGAFAIAVGKQAAGAELLHGRAQHHRRLAAPALPRAPAPRQARVAGVAVQARKHRALGA